MPHCELEDADQGEAEAAGRGIASLFHGVPLPSRMRPGPPLDPQADWAAFVSLVRPLLRNVPEDLRLRACAFEQRLTREPEALDAARAVGWAADLLAACPQLGGHAASKRRPAVEARAVLAHLARWLVARSGAAGLVACLDVLEPGFPDTHTIMAWSFWYLPSALALRSAIVAAPQAEYDTAVAECRRRAVGSGDRARERIAYLAYVLGDDRPDADHELRGLVQLPLLTDAWPHFRHRWRVAPLAIDLPHSQAAPFLRPSEYRGLALEHVSIDEVAATAIAVAARAGESPMPVLAWLLGETQGADSTTVARAILATGDADALAALLPFLGSKLVRDALDAADAVDPGFMLRAGLAALAGKGAAVYRPRVEALLTRHGDDAAMAWAKEGSQTVVGRLDRLIAARAIAFAPREAWPGVLREPPWRRKGKAPEPISLDLAPIATRFAYDGRTYEANDRDGHQYHRSHTVDSMRSLAAHVALAEGKVDYRLAIPAPAEPLPDAGAAPEQVLAWLGRRLAAAGDELDGFYAVNYGPWFKGVAWQPEPLALLLWNMTGPLSKVPMRRLEVVSTMLARFGAKAAPGLARLLAARPDDFMPLVAMVDAAELAPVVVRLLATRVHRAAAMAWLRRHPRTATMRLLPDALGPAGATRQAAEHALHALLAADPGARPHLDAAIAAYAALDPRVRGAVAAGLDADPIEQAPRKVPKLPAWIVPAALARPRLASGDALPDAAVAALCEMLAFSSPLAPYAGVAQVRAACSADSLDAFAMDLFRAWVGAGAGTASDWAMRAMVQVGGPACARDLTRQVRVWASEKAKPKALRGLDVLAAMGSDVALMNLNAIAEKSPFAKLRALAGQLIGKLAETRGLSLDELADRLTPDLGLDERGGLDLSFGPRAFRVGFDEMLRPWVRDAEGRRLAALPRPTKADDASVAKATARRWTGLKRDAEAVAALQVSRLETMMSCQRRVPPDVFWTFFATHPLMRHLAGRLVWGVFEGATPHDRLQATFRIAEDLSLTGADDAPIAFDREGAGCMGPVHPLHLQPETLAAWSALFADFEIQQPFPQLGRETFALADGEAKSARLSRFDGKRVAGGRLRGLRPRGWTTEGNTDLIRFVQRPVRLPRGDPLVALLAFEDGFGHHPGGGDGVQTLRALSLQDEGRDGPSATRTFGDLDAVTASEVLRTPSLLAPTGA